MNTLLLLFACPLCITIISLFRTNVRWLPRIAAGFMVLQLPVVGTLCLISPHPTPGSAMPFSIDGIGAAFIVITTLVATAAIVQAAFLFPAERLHDASITDQHLRLFYLLSGLFISAMYTVLLAQNLGYLWIAMEATTLVSAPLVYFHRSRHALEAAWKYLLLCSVGIAFALLGTVLLVAAQHTTGGESTLHFNDLLTRAASCDQRLLRFAFIFCLLGYGTKAGIFPLHNWLPDAHSEAPAPASAMLSGALLNCALVALWRIAQVMTAAGQGDLVRHLLVPAGAITVVAAGILLLRQHDIKRMWAYSSVEHVGLLTLAIGIGATPLFLLHALNHSLIKVTLFLLAGGMLYLYGTKALKRQHGLLRTAPAWGIVLAAASFAIAGSPPFGTFISEWLLLRDTFAAGEPLAATLVIIGLTITFLAITTHVGRILFGERFSAARSVPIGRWVTVPGILIVLVLLTGLAFTPKAMALVHHLATTGGILR